LLIWKFCEAHRESLVDKAKALQAEACDIVRQCFQTNEYRAFWEGTNVFTRHFRDAYKFQDPSYALPQPPIVAIPRHRPAGGSGHQQNDTVLNMEVRSQGAQQQFELLLTDNPVQTPDATATIPFGTASNANIPVHHGSGFTPEYRRSSGLNYGLAANGVQELAQQNCPDGQYGYQSFDGMNGVERPPIQDVSYGSVPFLDPSGDGQVQSIETYETGDQIGFDWSSFLQTLGDPSLF
jgi:hypothetical protein